MAFFLGITLFIFGSFIGLSFPDLDTRFYWSPVLVHRSALTHSALLPLLLLFALRRPLGQSAKLFLIGLSLATAVHLGFDLCPRAWYGFALVNIPFYGQTTAAFSQVWILGSLIACLILTCHLIRSMGEFIVSFFGLIVAYGVCAAKEPWASFYALLWLLPLSFFTFVFSRPKNDPDDPGARLRQLLRHH